MSAAKKAAKQTNQTTTPAPTPTPTPAPAAVAAKQEPAPAATVAEPVSKQQVTINKLIEAFKAKRSINVTPKQLVQDGKFINLILGAEWPTIRVGTSGGITVLELKSYTSAFDAAVEGDKLYAAQKARDAKRAAAAAVPAPAPAVKQEEQKVSA